MKERDFQKKLIKRLKEEYPGAIIMKNDANYIQGIPDLTILYKKKWATLEVKESAKAKKRPNQEHYVNQMNEMSFSAFIYPENEDEVLHDLERSLKGNSRRRSRISESE